MQFAKRTALIKDSSTLSITAKAKEMRDKGLDVVTFAGGEPDFNTPDYINESAIAAIRDGFTKYTAAAGTPELRRAVADKLARDNGLHYKPSQIVVGNGGKHCLANIFLALLNDGDEVLIPAPYWLSYPQMVYLAGGEPVIVYTKAENGFKVQPEELEAAVTEKTKIIVLNSPSNPTGMIYTRAELESVAAFAKKHNIYIISDEVYEKLIYDEGFAHISIASLNEDAYNRTIMVNALSKTYAMTGWRIGYLACAQELADVITNIQSHMTSNPNSIAQKVNKRGGKEMREILFKSELNKFGTFKDFLAELLAEGEVDSNEVYALAEEQGIPRRTLERAKSEIGARSVQRADGWIWTMD